MTSQTRPTYQCSFCGKTQDQVRRLIAGPYGSPRGIYICNECVALCQEILDDVERTAGQRDAQRPPAP